MVSYQEVLKFLEQFEVVVLYRNKANSLDLLKYEVRQCLDLSQIKFSVEQNKQWLDVQGYQKWSRYSFPAIKLSKQQAKKIIGHDQKFIIICALRTIVLHKQKNGKYKLIQIKDYDKMKELDQFRKSAEANVNFCYKYVQNDHVTTVYDFNQDKIQHLINNGKGSVDHIYNNKDRNSIKLIKKDLLQIDSNAILQKFINNISDQSSNQGMKDLKDRINLQSLLKAKTRQKLSRGNSIFCEDINSNQSHDQQKYFKFTLSEILKTSAAIEVSSAKDCIGINKQILLQHQNPRNLISINKSIQNLSYSVDQIIEKGVFTYEDSDGKLHIQEDNELDLIGEFKRCLYQRVQKTIVQKIKKRIDSTIDIIFLRQGLYFEELNDYLQNKTKIFKIDPKNDKVLEDHIHLDCKNQLEHDNDTLLVVNEKCRYTHDDLSIRPLIMIQTAGNPGDQTEIKSMHLVQLDLNGIKIKQQTQIKFLHMLSSGSYGQILEKIGLTASSPLTVTKKYSNKNDLIYKQRYQIVRFSPSISMHEIQEYEFTYEYVNGNFKEIKQQLVGINALVTTESFNSNKAAMYSLYDQNNQIIGVQLIFGSIYKEKQIFNIENPSNTNKFEKFALTQMKITKFLPSNSKLNDKTCLIQVQLNDLRIKNSNLFKLNDAHKDLYHSLFLAINSTMFNVNQIFDRGRKSYDDLLDGYAPHVPIKLLHFQNMLNLNCKIPKELKKIIDLMNVDQNYSQKTILDELIQDDQQSRYPQLVQLGVIKKAQDLYNTLDLNFENILSHITKAKCRQSFELINDYILLQNSQNNNQYLNFYCQNLQKMIDLNYLDYIPWIFEEFGQGVTFEQQIEDIRLNPNQQFQKVIYHQEDPLKDQNEQVIEILQKTIEQHEGETNDQEMYTKVQFAFIDWGPLIFEQSLQMLYDEKATLEQQLEIPYITRPKMQKILNRIIEQMPNKVENFPAVQELIDKDFYEHTRAFNQRQLIVMVCLQALPFIIMTFNPDNALINLTTIVMQVLASAFFCHIEIRQLINTQFEESYFESLLNFNDLLFLVSNISLLTLRIKCLFSDSDTFQLQPDWDADDSNYDPSIIITSMVVYISQTVKILSLLRQYKRIGILVAFLEKGFSDISGFLIFFGLMTVTICTLYKMTGARFNMIEYIEIFEFLAYLIQTTRNSIGDIQAPHYSYWLRIIQRNPEKRNLFAWFMIAIIWSVFCFFNMILMLICMLNFLIAIISETYSKVNANHTNNIYLYRSILNLEFTEINSEDTFEDKFSMNIMVCQVKPNDQTKTDNALQSLSTATKELFSSTQKQIRINKNAFSKEIETVKEEIETLDNKFHRMLELQEKNSEEMKEIKNILMQMQMAKQPMEKKGTKKLNKFKTNSLKAKSNFEHADKQYDAQDSSCLISEMDDDHENENEF